MNEKMKSILHGVKVLDLSRVMAGPLCTQWLADLGATVYKIERPGVGDDMRHILPQLPGASGSGGPTSTSYAALNRGKKSITIDISTEAGQAIIRKLALRCEILVENYKAGDLARYGLDYGSLRPTHADLIYCSITGYGQDGPLAARPGYDPVFQAISGMMSTCGVPDGQPGAGPQRTTVPFTDVMTGMVATTAVLAALLHQRGGPGGQHIDLALIDVAMAAMMPYAQTYLSTGKVTGRSGNTSVLFAPSNCYTCAGGRFILVQVGNDLQWTRLCAALGRDDWKQDARFASNPERLKHSAELNGMLNAALSHWDLHALATLLGDAGVACAPVNSIAEAFEHPQVQHRQIRIEVDDPVHGKLPMVRSPLRYSETPVIHGVLPQLGQHTDEVLQQELQMDSADIGVLRGQGVV